MGVEIPIFIIKFLSIDVTPCEGVGVEIRKIGNTIKGHVVTPCEGVGVEINSLSSSSGSSGSRLARAWE